ncbi:MAG TPA: isoamylase early set domain-containing protein, partial [Longimicrobiales bacterium]|nr:isoamylase early set domain-containing protein [Longimicrobiales bacterium]
RVIGPATVELRGGSYDARNQVADGRYAGVDATVALSLGALDVSLGARRWDTPTDGAELGGHAGIGLGLGEAAYLQAMVSRSVSDPVSGISGDVGISAGISVRVGRRALGGPPPAAVGTVQGRGRVVRFALKQDARSVDVAGDFSGWERRPLTRGENGEWTLETVLEPGVYHYSFVIDGETWMVPPDASGLVDDGFGRKNATLVVAALENGR